MTVARAKTTDLLQAVRTTLRDEAKAAAGGNTLLSKAEQARLPDGLLKTAAEQARAAGGPGARITPDAVAEKATADIERLLGQVNQQSGSGAAIISAAEVAKVAALNPEAGSRVIKAYGLLTGRAVEIPETGNRGSAEDRLKALIVGLAGQDLRVGFNSASVSNGTLSGMFWMGGAFFAVEAKAEGGVDRFTSVKLRESVPAVDPTLRRALEDGLRSSGVTRPKVLGLSRSHQHDGVSERWVAYDSSAGMKVVPYRFDAQGPVGAQPWSMRDEQLGQLVLDLARDRALELAANVGDEARLEVHARAAVRTAADVVEVTDPGESAVGFDAATERQFQVSSTWGDNAVFVTIHKQTGALRVEDFN